MSIIVETPFQNFTGLDGKPLTNGKVYIGQVGTDPTVFANQIPIFWDEALTIPASQPLTTNAGYIVRFGTPARVWVATDYSISVKNASNILVYYIAQFGVVDLSLYAKLSDLASSIGSSLIGFLQNGIGAIIRTVQSKLRERVTVLDFMTEAEREDVLSFTGALDVGASCDKAIAYVASLGKKGKLRFPGGLYSRSTTWDFSYPGFFVEGDGRFCTILKYTGSGVAVRVDDSRPNNGIFAFTHTMRDFCIEGTGAAQILLYLKNMNHSNWSSINLREASSTTGVGFKIEGSVAGKFEDIVCSTNAQLMTNRPFNGLIVDRDPTSGGRATDNVFTNLIVEGMMGDGVQIINSDQSMFIGGTSENNDGNGVTIAAGSRMNTFISVGFENRGFADIFDGGFSNQFINCYTNKRLYVDTSSLMSKIDGGFHQDIVIAGDYATVQNLKYSFFSAGGVFTPSANTSTKNIFNANTSSLTFPVKTPISVFVSASPFSYTNGSGLNENIIISGGIVTQIIFNRNGGPIANVGSVGGMFPLSPTDGVTISYTAGSPPSVLRIPSGTNYI